MAAAAVRSDVARGGAATESTLLVRHAVQAFSGGAETARQLIIDGTYAPDEGVADAPASTLNALLDAADAGQHLLADVRSALDDIWARDARQSSGVLDAAEAAGRIVAGAAVPREAQRAAALAAALCLARRGITGTPYLTVWQLDATARSAAVQVDRSQSWEEWIRAWCALLAREATALSGALRDAAVRMDAERSDVRQRVRTGGTDEAVAGWLHGVLRFTIAGAATGLGLTTPTVGTAIERLEARGYATELTGQHRDRVWVSTALLDLASMS